MSHRSDGTPASARLRLGLAAAAAALAAAAATGLAACGDGGADPERSAPAVERAEASREPNPPGGFDRRGPSLEPAQCPDDGAPCRVASGTIVHVEAVDPDGDGDAHFVLVSREGITAPGISVIDLPAELRPDPLPGVGERISAAGPVRRGSYGQRQIEAVELSVAGR